MIIQTNNNNSMLFEFFKKHKVLEINKEDNKDNFFVEKTGNTPEVLFKTDGECIISGNSLPETLDDFYLAAKKYLRNLISKEIVINFTFDYDYFNTSTQRYNYEILEELDKAKIKGVTIWRYIDIDEDAEDMGNIYKAAFPELKIKLKSKK